MLVRDPTTLFARHGRQLLVQGVQFDGQQMLFQLGVAVSAAAGLETAAGAAALYLTGAGVGRVAVPSAGSAALTDLDPAVALVPLPAALAAPAVHLHLVARDWGAAADLVWLGPAGEPRVCGLHWRSGRAWQQADSVALGAAVAGLVVEAVLGVAPLPALTVVDLTNPAAPNVSRTAHRAGAQAAAPSSGPGAVDHSGWQTWMADAAVLAAIAAASEAAYPDEACGVVGRDEAGTFEVWPAANLQSGLQTADPDAHPRTARTAYALDTRVLARLADAKQALVAIWHSHADSGAHWSAEDTRGAAPDGQPLDGGVFWGIQPVVAGRAAGPVWFAWNGAAFEAVEPPRD